jgi:hypothetical protein
VLKEKIQYQKLYIYPPPEIYVLPLWSKAKKEGKSEICAKERKK